MRIRRHLFFYNTVSVLVALVAMLAVNSAATHAIARYYQRQAEEMFQAMRVNVVTQEGMVWLDRGMGELELVGAIPARPASLGRTRPRMEAMSLSLFLSGGAAIVVVLLLNTLFTRCQLKKPAGQRPHPGRRAGGGGGLYPGHRLPGAGRVRPGVRRIQPDAGAFAGGAGEKRRL